MFPAPFAGDDALYTMKTLTLYAKITLELLCKLKVIPALVVTNDWYSGLIPAYIKNKSFGETFIGTKIFHIAHNLDTSYEVNNLYFHNYLFYLFSFINNREDNILLLSKETCTLCTNFQITG